MTLPTVIEFARGDDRALVIIDGHTIRLRRANALTLTRLLRDSETGEIPVLDGSISFGLLVDGDTADLAFANDHDLESVARIHRSQGAHLAAQLDYVTPRGD